MAELSATPPGDRAQGVVEEVAAVASPAEKHALAIDQKLIMTEVQLLLAEKRTAYALLRTGVTVSVEPLSLWTVLITTSRLWSLFDVLWLLIPVVAVLVVLFALGIYLIVHALRHIRHTDEIISGLRKTDTMLEALLYKQIAMPMAGIGRALVRNTWGRFPRKPPRVGS